uniref:Uncharacterized protein n=1 Tax=Cucumis sativus TaxID=3659 RepID=A0A0A0L6C1_CUCSA
MNKILERYHQQCYTSGSTTNLDESDVQAEIMLQKLADLRKMEQDLGDQNTQLKSKLEKDQEQEGGEEDPKNYEVVRADDPNMINTTRYYEAQEEEEECRGVIDGGSNLIPDWLL